MRYRQTRHAVRGHLDYYSNIIRIIWKLRIQKKSLGKKVILVCLLEHLGDVIACEPIARHLKERNPNAYIVWGVKKTYRELIDSNPHVDMTLIIHCMTVRMRLMAIGLFDEIVDLHFQDRYCSLCSRPLRRNYDGNPINLQNYFNYGSLLAAMSKSVLLPALKDTPKVYIPINSVKCVDGLHLPKQFIAVNCMSNNAAKDWPEEKWLELTDMIVSSYNLPVVEVGIWPLLDESRNVKYINLCGLLSILDSAEVIRRAVMFIGIDSGPAHMANAVGTYGIILLGSFGGFESYNPFSGHYSDGSMSAIIHADGAVSTITTDTVFKEVSKYLG